MTVFETINPLNLKDALSSLSKRNIIPVAGGTDVLVKFYEAFDRPLPKLLVINGIKSLYKIKVKDGRITLGPLVTFSDIEQSQELKIYAPQLVQAASVAGSVQIRNRATIGGNIANGSPAGDLIPPLYVLDAELELSSIKSKRIVPIDKYFKGPGITVLRKNELITSIFVNKSFKYGRFLRLATRKALAISKVSIAVNFSLRNNIVDKVRIAMGAVAPTVIRATCTEEFLSGKELNNDVLAAAAEVIKKEANPITDIRSNAEYRREMIGVLFRRSFGDIIKPE